MRHSHWISPHERDEIRRLDREASPMPWSAGPGPVVWLDQENGTIYERPHLLVDNEADAALIARYRNVTPRLLLALDRAERELAKLRPRVMAAEEHLRCVTDADA